MAEDVIGWRFIKDPRTGTYNLMDNDNPETIISSGKFSKVARRLVDYTKRTRLPTYMLFNGAWYYILLKDNESITIRHNVHDAAAEEDVESLGIDKPLEEWTLEEKQQLLEIRDKRDASAKAQLQLLAGFIRATGTNVEVIED